MSQQNKTEIVSNDGMTLTVYRERDDPAYLIEFDGPIKNSNIEFSRFQSATLLFGLWKKCGPFSIKNDPNYIPTLVASEGQEAIAAYLGVILEDTAFNAREYTAEVLSIDKQTVSNYWNKIRWEGCTECASENIRKKSVMVNDDEVLIAKCLHCWNYYVIPEDLKKKEHEKQPINGYQNRSMCTELEHAVGFEEHDKYDFWCCMNCGFFTAEKDRH